MRKLTEVKFEVDQIVVCTQLFESRNHHSPARIYNRMSVLVIPGDEVHLDAGKPVLLGPGMYCNPKDQTIRPVNAGILNTSDSKKGQTVYIDYDSKRYMPAVGDLVIGNITGAYSDSYRVSLSSFSTPVSLSYMAFPNASKKNRPTLKVGDLTYARVCYAEKELEAEIECMDSSTGQDTGFGLLEGGMIIEVSLGFARRLLFDNDFPLMKLLAQHTQFEIAIGLNGKIWINCEEVKYTLACYRSILESKENQVTEYKNIIKKHFKEIANAVEE